MVWEEINSEPLAMEADTCEGVGAVYACTYAHLHASSIKHHPDKSSESLGADLTARVWTERDKRRRQRGGVTLARDAAIVGSGCVALLLAALAAVQV